MCVYVACDELQYQMYHITRLHISHRLTLAEPHSSSSAANSGNTSTSSPLTEAELERAIDYFKARGGLSVHKWAAEMGFGDPVAVEGFTAEVGTIYTYYTVRTYCMDICVL